KHYHFVITLSINPSIAFNLFKHQTTCFIAYTYLIDTLSLLTKDRSSSKGDCFTYLPLKHKSLYFTVTPSLCIIFVSYQRLIGSVAQQNSISSTTLGPTLK